MENYEKHLEALDGYLVLRNYSLATRKSYACALKQFFKYRSSQGISGPFSQDDARNYLLARYALGRKWQTINGDYSAMYHFYKRILKIDWDVQHIPRPRKEQTLPVVISKKSIQKIIEQGAIFKHQVFMTLLYCTGLRLSEALHLRLADIDGERLQIHVVKGKGAKDRYVEMPVELLKLLRQYYQAYRPKEYLFNGKRYGTLWANRSAQWSIHQAREASGISQRVSPHVFRHCYATHHLEEGTNLVYLKEQLGHKNLKTTAKYIRLCKSYPKRVQHPIVGMKVVYQPDKR